MTGEEHDQIRRAAGEALRNSPEPPRPWPYKGEPKQPAPASTPPDQVGNDGGLVDDYATDARWSDADRDDDPGRHAPHLHAVEPGEAPRGDGRKWRRDDLLDDDGVEERTTIFQCGDIALIYPGQRHLISGPPECMKTWFALAASAQEVAAGRTVVWVNTDGMRKASLRERLVLLGLDVAAIRDRFVAYSPAEAPADGELDAIAREHQPSLAVIDSIEPTGVLLGLDTNSSADVETLMGRIVTPFHQAGVATMLLDHVTKNPDTRGHFSIGSQRKLAAVDVHLGMRVIGQPLTRQRGQARIIITCHKDRSGALVRGNAGAVAELHITSADQLKWWLTPPEDTDADGGFRPTTLMRKVHHHIESNPGATQRAITSAVEGKATYIRKAITLLIEEGYITTDDGPRGSTTHTTIRPYTDHSANANLTTNNDADRWETIASKDPE